MNYLNLSDFSVAFTIDLSNGFPPPFGASSLYRGSYFELNIGLRSNIPRFLFLLKQRIEVSHPNLNVERSWVPFSYRVSLFLARFASFGIRASVLVSGLSIL